MINIRRPSTDQAPDPESQFRAEMTDSNLKSTIQAILAANIAGMRSASPSFVFTHFILYGDFSTVQEATDVIAYTKKCAEQYQIPAPGMLYISAPWRTLKADPRTPPLMRKQTELINNCWANFRGDGDSFLGGTIDSIPMQVKVINFYTALKLRYANRICVIGFRSGFLEAAGFLGIPIFYMNETNVEDFSYLKFDDGRMLWYGPEARRIENRLGMCSEMITTFIAVDVPGPKNMPTEPQSSQKQSAKRKSHESKRPVSPESTQNVKLESQGKKQLMAALYMYMLSEDERGNLLWQRRREMMNSEPPTPEVPTNVPTASTVPIEGPSTSTPLASAHAIAKRPLGEGQMILKKPYEECEALWNHSVQWTDKTSAYYRVQQLLK